MRKLLLVLCLLALPVMAEETIPNHIQVLTTIDKIQNKLEYKKLLMIIHGLILT